MTPADGGFFDFTPHDAVLTPDLAILLPGGRTLLALSRLGCALPRRGFCGDAPWRAICWPANSGRAGLALVETSLIGSGRLRGPGDGECEIAPAQVIDVAPAPLGEFVRRSGLNSRKVFEFLLDALVGNDPSELPRGDREFVDTFLSLASEAGGFVEILASPDTGGFFAQGWAMLLAHGPHRLTLLDGALEPCKSDVAIFSREDIPPPGTGFCLFSRDWRGDLASLECLFYEQDGILKRLEVVRGSVLRLRDEAATDHVRNMLPRLACDEAAAGAFRRICRPRYQGNDTLSATDLPIAAAFDAVFEAPLGGLLATGWLLDPLQRVERVIVKSSSGLYAPLHDRWHPLPRADLNEGFSADPRFARILDPSDITHGFIAFAEGRPHQGNEEFYLELILDDGSCLFRPLKITRLDGRELLPHILAAIPLHDPALDQIVEDALAPFLARLPARQPKGRAAQRPIPLSDEPGEIAAIVPLSKLDHLQPMMALLAGTAEAKRLDLVIVMARGAATGATSRLKDLFAFYGIRGRLLLVADQTDFCARIEAGLVQAHGSRVLIWQPSALPATQDWLTLLEDELELLGSPGLISPTLVYEDGSVLYGGDGATQENMAPMLGYPLEWMVRGAPRAMPSGAAQLALIDREAMADAGGFSGRLYSDAMVHRDLARRLHAQGFGSWASRRVDFWVLEDPPADAGAIVRLLERVDSSLMGNMAATASGDRLG